MSRSSVRRYESPLRQAQAAMTRRTVIEAATRLFIERGFVGTSIDAIAAAAGVSRATVFTSVGGKGVLLKTAYDVALVGDDEALPRPQRPWAQGVRTAQTPPSLLEAASRVGAIPEAMRGAASADEEVSAVWAKIEAERRTGAGNIVRLLEERGGIRPGLDPASAADIIWLLNDPGLYVRLVGERGWTREAWRDWLAATLRQQVLEDA